MARVPIRFLRFVLKYGRMNQFKPPKLPRNPVTHAAHRHEVLLQVFLPLAIGAIVILTLSLGAAIGSFLDVSRWADISLIWLILIYLAFALVFLVFLVAMIFGVAWLLHNLPIYARQAQDLFILIRVQVGRVSDKAVEPFLRVHSFTAGLKGIRRK
jgi:hypothetical protein